MSPIGGTMPVHFPRHRAFGLAKPCGTMPPMTSEDADLPTQDEALAAVLRAAAKEKRAHEAAERALAELGDAVAVAYRVRIPPSRFLGSLRHTRETVRRWADERGVAPLRPGTVVSRKRAHESAES